jgi:hypothetical protein
MHQTELLEKLTGSGGLPSSVDILCAMLRVHRPVPCANPLLRSCVLDKYFYVFLPGLHIPYTHCLHWRTFWIGSLPSSDLSTHSFIDTRLIYLPFLSFDNLS